MQTATLGHAVTSQLKTYHDKDQKEQEHSKAKSNLGKELYAVVQSAQDADRGHSGNAPDCQVLDPGQAALREVLFDPTQILKAGNNVNGSQSQRSAHARDRCDNSKAIHHVSHPSPRIFTKDWVKARAKRLFWYV